MHEMEKGKMRNKEMASKTFLFLCIFMVISKSFAASDFKMIDTAQLHAMIMDNANYEK